MLHNICSNIFLIANNKYLNKELFNSINENDIIVLYNNSVWIEHFKDYPNKIIFMRWKKNLNNIYNGYNIANKYDFLHSYFINGYPRNPYFKKFKFNKTLINNKNNIHKIGYPKDKSPTTGFWSYFILKKKYPNHHITLVGFDLNKNYVDIKSKQWNGHAFKFEKNFIFNSNINTLN